MNGEIYIEKMHNVLTKGCGCVQRGYRKHEKHMTSRIPLLVNGITDGQVDDGSILERRGHL